MPDAIAETREAQSEQKPTALSSGVPAQETLEAIQKAFPYEGDLRVRHLWSGNGIARHRANWFGQVDGRMRLVKSLFLCLTRTKDGLVVQNETAVR